MGREIEILSPAGSYECLKAAIAAGADAAYVGGTRFGARAYADNFSEEQLLEAIDYVHLHGKKIYLTVNTLLKERELSEELYDYLLPYYRQGLDAVIVQDIGVLQFIKSAFPDLPIHASTQMTITNRLGAEFLEKLGVERVVTSREMQLPEVEEIARHTNLEIESFVHGALCYSYSGQCLYSSLLGGRSGNRGQCAQPCRLPYKMEGHKKNQYLLSLKDMCTVDMIPAFIQAGIHSFKIEGRMKKPEYVALVTSIYRKYVDLYMEKGEKGFFVTQEDKNKLLDIYNRGGFHSGYYQTKNGKNMLCLERPNHAGVPALSVCNAQGRKVTSKALIAMNKGDVIELPNGENHTLANDVSIGSKIDFITQQKQVFDKNHILYRTRNEGLLQDIRMSIIGYESKERVSGQLILSVGNNIKLTLQYKHYVIEVSGEKAEKALNQPMDVARIEKQMRKTGNTPFEFEKLEIELHGEVFLPMQALNELRRKAFATLEQEILSEYRRNKEVRPVFAIEQSVKESEIPIYVYVETREQWDTVLSFASVKRIYVDCNAIQHVWENQETKEWIARAHRRNIEIYFCMPHVFRRDAIETYDRQYEFLTTWDGVLVRNYESFEFLKQHRYSKPIVTDYNLYQFNRVAKEFWSQQGVESTTASVELNYQELKEVGLNNSELIVYGHYPMMISAQCIQKTTNACVGRSGRLAFTDRYNKSFSVKNQCDYCYNVIYNTAPVLLSDQKDEISKLNPKALRIHFTIEDEKTTKQRMQFLEHVFSQDGEGEEPHFEFTRGHFKRGIK